MKNFKIVVAMDKQQGIGKDGDLPWRLPSDLRHFRDITTTTKNDNSQNVVVMGRVTWDSLPEKYRPLPGRVNVVLTRNSNLKLPAGVIRIKELSSVVEVLNQNNVIYENIFVIGGQQVYASALESKMCDKLYVTHLHSVYDCDTFFPAFDQCFTQTDLSSIQTENHIDYQFAEYSSLDL